MQQRQQLIVNIAMSVLQTIVLGVIPFILYRFLLNTIGIEQLGLWSLVLSTTSITRIAELGFSSSVVKYVANYLAHGQFELAAAVIETAALSVFVSIGMVLIVAYPLIARILAHVVPPSQLINGLALLPFALLSLFLSVLTGVFQSGLDGSQRIDQRSYVTMVSTVFYFILTVILTPKYGLMGLAYAQIIQAIATLVVSWLLVQRLIPYLSVVPFHWNRAIFLEIFGYAANFQVSSLMAVLYEPTTMALLSRYGGLSLVGYYQMAKKLVTQVRALLISGNRAIVPFVADRYERKRYDIKHIYAVSFQSLLFFALPTFALLVAVAPPVSKGWIGEFEYSFVIYVVVLSIGWLINAISSPAYFMNMGSGNLRWNTVSSVLIAIVNLLLASILGYLFGGNGVVIAWAIALAIGSILVVAEYQVTNAITVGELQPIPNITLGISCVTGVLVAWLAYYRQFADWHWLTAMIAVTTCFMAIVFVPLWRHPQRIYLTNVVVANLPKLSLQSGRP